MLSAQEKAFASELLGGLEFEELLAIAKTTTNGCLNPSSKEEAIGIITSYEEDPLTLLTRKKVTKVLLFNYLHWKKVEFPANSDKSQLIEIVLQFWTSCSAQSGNNNCVQNITHHSHQQKQLTINTNNAVQDVSSRPAASLGQDLQKFNSQSERGDVNPDWVNIMALKFSEWFYSMLNGDPNSVGEFLKEEDFWKDSVADIKLSSGCDSITYDANNSKDIIEIIKGVKREHKLIFCPNLTAQGVKGKLDPHGIVLVAACGTLHLGVGQCVGVFEQIFSLIKDPLSCDNWKVKRTTLNLRKESNVTGPPCLEQGGLSNQLQKA